jgi:hypothetical protein
MNPFKHLLIIATLLFGGIHSATAMFESLPIHVISFTPAKKGDSYTIVFDAETTDYGDRMDLPRKKRRFTVALRREPRFCTLEQYQEAVQLLRRRIAESSDVTVARMSGTGWRPVPGKRGVFESVGLLIPRPPADYKGTPVLLFIHGPY